MRDAWAEPLMARHRKRPVPRHHRRTDDRAAGTAGSQEARAGAVIRRLVMTPTFAAGLGVLVAAVLVYQMGPPSFRVTMPPLKGPCAVTECSSSTGQGQPAAKGGERLHSPAPVAGRGGRQVRHRHPGPGPGPTAPPQPAFTYQTEHVWGGGFIGYLTVSFAGGHVPGHWLLRLSYRAARIARVWGLVRWRPSGEHTAIITAASQGWYRPGGDSIQIWIWAAGHPGRPRGCSFDHEACHIG